MESGNPSKPIVGIAKAGGGNEDETAKLLQDSFEKILPAEDKPQIGGDVEIGGDDNELSVQGDLLSVSHKPQIQDLSQSQNLGQGSKFIKPKFCSKSTRFASVASAACKNGGAASRSSIKFIWRKSNCLKFPTKFTIANFSAGEFGAAKARPRKQRKCEARRGGHGFYEFQNSQNYLKFQNVNYLIHKF